MLDYLVSNTTLRSVDPILHQLLKRTLHKGVFQSCIFEMYRMQNLSIICNDDGYLKDVDEEDDKKAPRER